MALMEDLQISFLNFNFFYDLHESENVSIA